MLSGLWLGRSDPGVHLASRLRGRGLRHLQGREEGRHQLVAYSELRLRHTRLSIPVPGGASSCVRLIWFLFSSIFIHEMMLRSSEGTPTGQFFLTG